MDKNKMGRWFWVETVLACASGFLGLLTLVWRDWIETVFNVDPDHGSGWAEWVAVAVLLVIAAVVGSLARTEWRKRHTTPAVEMN